LTVHGKELLITADTVAGCRSTLAHRRV